MQPITIQFAVTVGYVTTLRISRENNTIQIDLPDGTTKLSPCLHVYLGDVWGSASADSLNCFFNKFDQMDSQIGFEISLIVVDAIQCVSFMILTETVQRYLVDRQTHLF